MDIQRGRVTHTRSHSKLEDLLEPQPSSLDDFKPAGRISREGKKQKQGTPLGPASTLPHKASSLHPAQRQKPVIPPFKGECPLQLLLLLPVELLPVPHPILPVSLPLSGSKCCQGNRITNDFPLCLGPWEETHKPSRCSLTPDAPTGLCSPSRALHPTPPISADYTMVASPGHRLQGPRCKRLVGGGRGS